MRVTPEQERRLSEEHDRAERAKVLLNDPLLNEALKDIREQIVEAMEAGAAKTVQEQARLILSLQVAQNFKKKLINHVNTGKLADATLHQVARGRD